MTVTGVTFDDLGNTVSDSLKPTPAFEVDVRDPNGQDVTGAWGMNDDWLGAIHVHVLAYRTVAGGNYAVRVTYLGASFDRTLAVR